MHNYYFSINPMVERQAQHEMLKGMKDACENDILEWLSTSITEEKTRWFSKQHIEFVFRLFSNPEDMYTHFTLVLYNQNIEVAQQVMFSLLKDFQYEVSCPIRDDMKIKIGASGDVAPLFINNVEVEQGQSYLTNEQDTVLVMGWDKERVYFLLNPIEGCLIGKEPLKSLPVERYAQLFA